MLFFLTSQIQLRVSVMPLEALEYSRRSMIFGIPTWEKIISFVVPICGAWEIVLFFKSE